ncbi:MAG: TIGR04086 family membrane protein [Lawsonibacter sp.]|nr:TIGR04086 family membrane protein [Lawsonibacter sp.]
MKKTGKRQEEQSGWMAAMNALAKGIGAALAVTLILLLLCAAAVSARWLSQTAMERSVIAVCVLGSLAGGWVSAAQRREMSVLLGLGTGAALFLLLTAIGVLFFEDAPAAEQIPVIFSACLCGGGAAGILGRKTKKKHRR